MNNFIKKYKLEMIGFGIGAIAGISYWYFVGCASGTCAITSKPLNSFIYGGIMGTLFFGMFKKEEKKSEINNQ
ncbi:MAG: DUF6132 family protein [Bacteroidetes bacterium]|jgi:LytS/YehU family sensor histidine kinase|nr:DUF6132 family protein [Bacteroidota bacterium]